jgi:hypothetical protein
MKKTWDGIRNLINVSKKSSININKIVHENKTFTDNKSIAKTLNNYFVNIGPSIEEKIPKAKSPFQNYLGERNPASVILDPCSEEEITEIISKFGVSKASGPFSIPIHILKEYSDFLVTPLTCIVNKSQSPFPWNTLAPFPSAHLLSVDVLLVPGALSCLSEVSSFRLAQLQAALLQEWLRNAPLQDPLSFHSALTPIFHLFV